MGDLKKEFSDKFKKKGGVDFGGMWENAKGMLSGDAEPKESEEQEALKRVKEKYQASR